MKRIFLAALLAASVWGAAAQGMRVVGEPAWANAKAVAAIGVRLPDFSAADTAQIRFFPIADARVQDVRVRNSAAEAKALLVGIHRGTLDEAQNGDTPVLAWKATPDGGMAARFAVTSPGARALRVALRFNDVPAGAELRFLGAATPDTAVALVGADELKMLRREQPVYWTPVTEGESQIVEIYFPPGASTKTLRLSVSAISHLIVSPYGKLDGAKASQSCERDVVCAVQTAQFVNAKNAVARMLFQDNCESGGGQCSFLCTGTLLNDTDKTTQVPYFYSANHCISTQAAASTLATFWFDERTTCGSGTSSPIQVAGGADLLFNDPARDGLLLRLRNPPPSGAFFLGWDSTTTTAGTPFTVIHHPAGDVKKVSLGQITGFQTPDNGPGGNLIAVGYTSASTEGGSSGSGLLTTDASGNYLLRGGLYGGAASCSNTGSLSNSGNFDYYSRFDSLYPNLAKFLAGSATGGPDYSGAWYNPNESGWGVSFARGDSGTYGMVMYHFNQTHQPVWYILSSPTLNGSTLTGTLLQISGAWAGEAFSSVAVSSVAAGTASVNFTSATTATFAYTISGAGSFSKNLSKLNF